jgi:menaquinone-dependent protoporphyrinogen oxidase
VKTLIAYATRYGTAHYCAEELVKRIEGETQLVDLSHTRNPPLAGYDTVIIGGSIYASRIQPAVVAFAEANREQLLALRVGLYICCLYEGEKAREELYQNFPAWLTAHAFAALPLGGRVRVDQLRWLDRLIYKKVAKMNEGIEHVLEDRIDELAGAARASE